MMRAEFSLPPTGLHTPENGCGGGTLSALLESSVTAMLIVRDTRFRGSSAKRWPNAPVRDRNQRTPREKVARPMVAQKGPDLPHLAEADRQREQGGSVEGKILRKGKKLKKRSRQASQR